MREVSAAAGSFRDLAQGAFVDAEGVAVADADRIDQGVSFLGAGDGFVHLHAAAGVVAVGEEDDGASRMFGGGANQLFRGGPNSVPDGCRSGECLVRAGDWRRSVDDHAAADVTGR